MRYTSIQDYAEKNNLTDVFLSELDQPLIEGFFIHHDQAAYAASSAIMSKFAVIEEPASEDVIMSLAPAGSAVVINPIKWQDIPEPQRAHLRQPQGCQCEAALDKDGDVPCVCSPEELEKPIEPPADELFFRTTIDSAPFVEFVLNNTDGFSDVDRIKIMLFMIQAFLGHANRLAPMIYNRWKQNQLESIVDVKPMIEDAEQMLRENTSSEIVSVQE